MNLYKLFPTPKWVYLGWLLLFILFLFIGIPLLSKGYSGGEQRPLVLLGYSLNIFIYGIISISILIPVLYKSWFKKYWYINSIIGLVCISIVIYIKLFN